MKFLAELNELDWDRALHVWNGRAVAQTAEYARALQAAVAVGGEFRRDEWLLAREAASYIARDRLGESSVTEEILGTVSDVAGAIVIRDLLPERDVEVLLLPWTWLGEESPAGPGAATVGAVEAGTAVIRPGRPRRRVQAWFAPVVAILAVIALGSAFAALNQPKSDLAAVGGTDALPSSPPPIAAAPSPSASMPAATSSPAVETAVPTPSAAPSVVTAPTARPTREPIVNPAPDPTPVPAPTPTPTPRPKCTVISLLTKQTAQAQVAWKKAGFTGTVTFSPLVPPHYEIQWQSLEVGSSVLCTRGITVRSEAP
jgi:hypothetical protein